MKTRLYAFAILLIIGMSKSHAQRAIYAEAFGHGLLYSINYDQDFDSNLGGWGFRAGFSYIPFDNSDVLILTANLNYLIGSAPHFFDLGFGVGFYRGAANFIEDDFGNGNIGFTGNVGYRYQKPKGAFFKIGISPLISSEFFAPYLPSAGFGFSF